MKEQNIKKFSFLNVLTKRNNKWQSDLKWNIGQALFPKSFNLKRLLNRCQLPTFMIMQIIQGFLWNSVMLLLCFLSSCLKRNWLWHTGCSLAERWRPASKFLQMSLIGSLILSVHTNEVDTQHDMIWYFLLRYQSTVLLATYQYNIKQTSSENKEKYQLGDYWSIQFQILQINVIIIWIVWQKVRGITNGILGVKGLIKNFVYMIIYASVWWASDTEKRLSCW